MIFILLSLCHDKCRICLENFGQTPVHNFHDIYFFVVTNIVDLHFYLRKICRDKVCDCNDISTASFVFILCCRFVATFLSHVFFL